MKETKNISRSRAQESSAAIEKMYITMRHLFNRGFYKPMGVSGDTLREALLALRPEIYGNIGEEKVELNGLLYVIERLPVGIHRTTRRWASCGCRSGKWGASPVHLVQAGEKSRLFSRRGPKAGCRATPPISCSRRGRAGRPRSASPGRTRRLFPVPTVPAVGDRRSVGLSVRPGNVRHTTPTPSPGHAGRRVDWLNPPV